MFIHSFFHFDTWGLKEYRPFSMLGILTTFLHCCNKATLRKKVYSYLEFEETVHQESETDDHKASTARKQRWVPVFSSSSFDSV